jgi:16S rRNA (uracil1498-N3)-methyltransferase
MRFLHHPEAGAAHLRIEGEAYRYLFKVRRFHRDDPLLLRNLGDDMLYTYRVESLDRRRATLRLERSEEHPVLPPRFLHLGWCIVDPKTVEKSLPALNEIGVGKITFIRCERSQRSFRPDLDRLRRILINSCQQCGRSRLMGLEILDDLSAFLSANPGAALLDFSDRPLECGAESSSLVIGPEGGVTEAERSLFPPGRIVGLETPLILRSESAAAAAASRILL